MKGKLNAKHPTSSEYKVPLAHKYEDFNEKEHQVPFCLFPTSSH